ncbi:hypothetical protein L7A47_33505, partial [Achromobacter xylosoxidans]|nr:hypothetical protein [Achromobacter xylosoxidans]
MEIFIDTSGEALFKRGYTGDFSVSKLLGNDNPKIARFESVPLIIKELENGGLDSVVSDSAVIANYVKN